WLSCRAAQIAVQPGASDVQASVLEASVLEASVLEASVLGASVLGASGPGASSEPGSAEQVVQVPFSCMHQMTELIQNKVSLK
ncbi:MAG: hypothetical protein MUO31_08570, partial [Thermodesulfovibrionales bacterium]|nr:hypothetical protein [Thermodesulfovibrionales bacterium]